MKALSLTIQKLRLFAEKQTDKQTGKKLYAPDLSMQGGIKIGKSFFFLN